MDIQYRSRAVIKKAHDKIDSLIKNGNEVARPLQRELRNVMWQNCGVVRDKKKLSKGLDEVNSLKGSVSNLDVRPDSEGYQDLMLAFDLEGSIMSAEATILGAIQRKESRGAHQRSDYPEMKNSYNINFRISIEDESLEINSEKVDEISQELKSTIKKTKDITNYSGMLLE